MANRFVDATLRLVDKFSSPLSKATAEMQAKGRQIQKTANSIKRTGKKLRIRRDIVGKKGNGADYRNHGRFWKNGGHI